MDEGLKLAIERAGSVRKLARMLGISMQAVVKWKSVPAHQIILVEIGDRRAAGTRPDLSADKRSTPALMNKLGHKPVRETSHCIQ